QGPSVAQVINSNVLLSPVGAAHSLGGQSSIATRRGRLGRASARMRGRPQPRPRQQALAKRLAKFARALEPTKTRLVAFGRFAERDAKRHGKRRGAVTVRGLALY